LDVIKERDMPLVVAMFGCHQPQGQLKQSLILLRLLLSDNTSQLEVLERPMHKEEHKEAQRRWKFQRTKLQSTVKYNF
jgi:hypothetical protein